MHADELLGKYTIPTNFDGLRMLCPLWQCSPPGTFEFDGMLWSSSQPDEMPFDQVSPIASKSHAAKPPPTDLGCNGHQEPVSCMALFDHPGCRGVPEALPKFPNVSREKGKSKGRQDFVGHMALFDHPGCRGPPEVLPKFSGGPNDNEQSGRGLDFWLQGIV